MQIKKLFKKIKNTKYITKIKKAARKSDRFGWFLTKTKTALYETGFT